MPLPTLPLRSRGFRVLQSRNLNSLGSHWLTSSPLALGFPQALGSSTVRRPDACEFAPPGIPLMHFDATSASHTTCAAQYSRRMPTIRRFHEAPRKAPTLQHDRFEEPFFSLPFPEASSWGCHPSRRSRSEGLATLSAAFSPSNLEGVSQPSTLMGFTLRSFSQTR